MRSVTLLHKVTCAVKLCWTQGHDPTYQPRLGLIGLHSGQNVEKVNLAWNVNVQVVLQY